MKDAILLIGALSMFLLASSMEYNELTGRDHAQVAVRAQR